jgi:hypothetical protein
MLLRAIQEFMSHYPIDDELIASLPNALREILDAFQADAAKPAEQKTAADS